MRTIMIGGKLMRGVETRIQEIRHRIFREVARMAYHTEWPVDKRIEELPYKIIPGEVGNFRNDVFLDPGRFPLGRVQRLIQEGQ